MGAMEVPADAYYGAQTRRAELNFEISPLRAPRAFIRAMGLIKKAAAQVNMDLGLLNPDLGSPIVQAAQAVAEGKHDDQFVVDIFQTGSGTSTNMNTNEVIAGVANEKLTGAAGRQVPRPSQRRRQHGPVVERRDPLGDPRRGPRRRPQEADPGSWRGCTSSSRRRPRTFDHIVKIGRTHLQDAVPIRLGQEFSGYASQIEHGIRRLNQARRRLARRTRHRRDGGGHRHQHPRGLPKN